MITKVDRISSLVAAAAGITIIAGFPAIASAHPAVVAGHVYQATNDAAGNAINVYDRGRDGSLTPTGSVSSGGLGAGVSLASQGGLTRDGRLVFVVNAGDDSVSALAATRHGLVLVDKISSGGDFPVSVSVHEGVGYVLNQHDDTISGFRYSASGELRSLPGSTRSLSPNPAGGSTGAAQVSFTPDGRSLVVTEKAANRIDTFDIRRGYAGDATPHESAGTTPYGFDFDHRGHAIISEAASGSVSSYRVRPFTPVTSALSDTQRAACWLVVGGKVAFVVNAASASISTYGIAGDGSLRLLEAVAATTEAGPTDAAISSDGRYLAVRVRSGSVATWRIGTDGALTPAGMAPGAAVGPAGLVAD